MSLEDLLESMLRVTVLDVAAEKRLDIVGCSEIFRSSCQPKIRIRSSSFRTGRWAPSSVIGSLHWIREV